MNISEQMPFLNYNNKEKNYAFVVNMKHKQSQGQLKNINKAQRTKGFYDELINYDYYIRKNKNEISNNKIKGIKKFVYSNNQIPSTWKDRIDYYQDCYKSLSSDKNFVAYLGRGNEYSSSKDKKELLSINSVYQTEPKFKELRTYSTGLITAKGSELNGKTNQQFIKRGSIVNFNPNKNLFINNERQIKDIFEDMRLKYPMRLTHKKREIELDGGIINETPMKNSYSNKNIRNFPNCQKEKPKVFKSTMYNHLLTTHNMKKTPVKKKQVNKTFTSLLLDSSTEEFHYIPTIKNKQIDNKLKDINYYGPHFSYCPPCRRKNNSFYNEMETEQCITLLNFLKTQRRKI